MLGLPPRLSPKVLNRTWRCVRCDTLTDARLDHCDACGYAFTDEDRSTMASALQARSRGILTDLMFAGALVGLVVLVLATW